MLFVVVSIPFLQLEVPISLLWLVAAFCLLGLELTSPGLFFFISFAGGSLVGAVLAAMGCSILTQCYGALAGAIVAFYVLHTYLRKWTVTRMTELSNTNALIGRSGIVVHAINPGHHGHVKIGGEEWVAESNDKKAYAVGTIVRVVAVKGNRVIVRL